MALYRYKAFSKEGKKLSGFIDAPSVAHVKQQLSVQGMYPVSIAPAAQEARQAWWKHLVVRGVTSKEKILFTKQLAVLLKSGVPLLQSFELLIDQFEAAMRGILVAVKDDIKEGMALADALKKYPKTFENIYVQLVRAGEATGRLEVILERLVDYLERRQAIQKRISAALSYPIMQLVVALVVVTVLLVYVVPTMKENFASQKKALPAPTEFLISLSNFLVNHYIIITGLLVAIVVGFRYWKTTPSGARRIDEIKLKLPLIKFFARTSAVVQFSQTLGMLTESGVNLSDSLNIVCNIIDNRILTDALNEARDKIIKQGKIAQYLKQTHIFPPIAIYLIGTGEETGKLDVMLLTVAKNYEEELGELADSLAAKIGPILLVMMAVVVGFIVLSMALPMVQMADIAGI
ncbi:type II secretion system F family protein [Candidatus Dependentiae bacterium]|nr:type II secretion system F family protein [Candidatus Dependentiae bacterium]